MKKNNRVYGVCGIRSINSNWNAAFDGNPKTTINGTIFGSDKALKYAIRSYWNGSGEKVLYFKSLKKNQKDGSLQPRDLDERYQFVFNHDLNDKKMEQITICKNLFNALDVENFGATFASKNCNISLTGAVQIGQGINKYRDTNIEVQDILSPFKNSNEKSEDSSQASIGKKIMVDEAHYFYGFSVNPYSYTDIAQLIGTEGYTQEAYEKLKDAMLCAASALNTCSKYGCDNEFALFVNMKEDSRSVLRDLAQYANFYKDETVNVIDLTGLDFLNTNENIDSIEIYSDPLTRVVHNLKGPFKLITEVI